MTAETTAPASLARQGAGGPATGTVLRPEIQALRALAVGAVLVFHLVPSRFPGGFVGVDIFFVISGFLITGHLVREIERTGSLRVARFWARRAKRLLPAALLVLAVTAVATLALVPRVLWGQFLGETMAAALYVENWRLVVAAVDYFAGTRPSPVQHFWSLSVEEQFYLVLPLLVLVAIAASRRVRTSPRTVLAVVLVAVTVVSFLVSLAQTTSNPTVAYFSSGTRAWQFAAGGLLALVPAAGRWASPPVRAAAALLGCLALLVTFLVLDERTPFPGTIAALPVLGTAAVIWSGTLPGRLAPSSVGRWGPVALLGRTSYAVYLWHWPLIVLLPMATGVRLRLVDMVAVTVATITLAYATTRWVEDPVRFSPRLLGGQRRPRTVAVWSVAGMAAVCALTAGSLAVSDGALDEARALREQAWAADVACLGAAALDGRPSSCRTAGLDGNLVPHPVLAPEDRYDRGDCWAGNAEVELRMCSLGPPGDVERRVLALGDSHSHMLLPAYEHVAQTLGWRVDVAGHANCYWTRASTPHEVAAFTAACADWRSAVDEHLRSAPPYDAILVIASRTAALAVPVDGLGAEAATLEGLRSAWAEQEARGTRIIAIADVPQPRRDVVECVVRHGRQAVEQCRTPAAAAGQPADMVGRAAHEHGAVLVDLTGLMCDADSCQAVVEDVVVWQDRGHVTATFARSLGPSLAARLAALLSP